MTTPSKVKPFHRLALASIQVFSNDGKLDRNELENLLGMALGDGRIDEDEQRVLANILRRAEADGVDGQTQARIDQIRQQYGLSA